VDFCHVGFSLTKDTQQFRAVSRQPPAIVRLATPSLGVVCGINEISAGNLGKLQVTWEKCVDVVMLFEE
jgi:hypothetical protein